MIIINVEGKIQGKSRPRFKRVGNYVKTYNTQNDTSYENLLKLLYAEQNKDNDSKIKYFNDEPLILEIIVNFDIPSSFSKVKRKKALEGEIYPTKKPDFDNIAKIVADALNKIAYKDDKQIVESHIYKRYNTYSYVEICIFGVNEKRIE